MPEQLKAEAGDESVIFGLESNEEWKYAWARAIAKAWELGCRPRTDFLSRRVTADCWR